MDLGTLLVIIIGAVGLIAVLWLRTRSHRVGLRHRASMMDMQLNPHARIDDDTREQALLLLDRNEKIAAIKLVHEQGGLGLRESRDFVAHLESTTTFEPNDPNAPTSLSSSEWRTDDARPAAHEGHDWRSDDSPAHSSNDWSSSDSGSHSSSDWSSSDSGSSDSGSSSSAD
ncbi:MAG: hypothetical protein H0T53_04350 [Herpetosiphonaceae bacterium]|nr:hypothetical protein [Herpetosiphonaceae bacterium]